MREILAAVLIVLSGCVAAAEPLSTPSEVIVDDVVEVSPEPASVAIDVDAISMLSYSEVSLVAYKATQTTHVEVTEDIDISFSFDGDATAFVDVVFPHASVDGLLARASDATATVSDAGWFEGITVLWAGGAPVAPTTVHVAGEDLSPDVQTSGKVGWGSGGARAAPAFDLQAGEYVLLGAGLCNAGLDDLDEDPVWNWTIEADHALERVELKAAPILCGVGFEPYYDNTVAGLHVGEASHRFDVKYGTTITYALGQGPDLLDIDWVTGNGTVTPTAVDGMVVYAAHDTAAGSAGFDVRQSHHTSPYWAMVGL